ncbi:MAG: tRNA lysidine(34) synthetase TilS [Mariprofundaceae bacterium]|nr:tRNA lysidine(34) synthetase TilS [Mariprofundaceae bacterium]
MDVKQQSIAVGWSGGIDSTALLLLLRQCGYHVQAWHVDHAWHTDSANHCDQLAAQAKAWGVSFFHRRLPAPKNKNREALARQGRFQAFSCLAKEHHVQTLCLAQHADDQAETVCMRLLQGASFKGCCGIHDQRVIAGLQILRPLLHLTKQCLKAALIQAEVPIIEDPSNDDLSLWRNRIRHRLFPAMLAVEHSPRKLFFRWQQQAMALNNEIMQLADNVVIHQEKERCYVAWLVWQSSIQPVRVEILQRMMACACGAGRILGRRHILLIDTWRAQGGRQGLDLSACRLTHKKSILQLSAGANLKKS